MSHIAMEVAAVAAGGAIGALSRWTLTLAAGALPGVSPVAGTTLANLIGCGLLGIVTVAATSSTIPGSAPAPLSGPAGLAIRVGLIGALTTFSTFIAEAVAMWHDGRSHHLATYLTLNLIGGVAAFIATAAWADHRWSA